MNAVEFAGKFVNMSYQEKLIFLASSIHELTICGRGLYNNDDGKLKDINEAINKVDGYLIHLVNCSVLEDEKSLAKMIFYLLELNKNSRIDEMLRAVGERRGL